MDGASRELTVLATGGVIQTRHDACAKRARTSRLATRAFVDVLGNHTFSDVRTCSRQAARSSPWCFLLINSAYARTLFT